MTARILVVDDMPIVSQGTALLLESMGYEVDQAASGAAALELFAAVSYVAIIMDYNMPKMNGLECAREIRKLEIQKGSRIPIICMSTANEQDMEERCLEAGLDSFLDKDCNANRLQDCLSALIHKPSK